MESEINELIDLKRLDDLLEGFNNATGFVTAIIDLKGNLLSKSRWRRICTDFHRINPDTSENCRKSDIELGNKGLKGEKYHSYTCYNGLTEVVVPLIVKDRHLANLISGQFFLNEPDMDFFKGQAIKYGFHEEDYLAALKEVPVISEEKVKATVRFLLQMTDFISNMGFDKKVQVKLNDETLAVNERLVTSNQNLIENEKALKESEIRYKQLVETAVDAIYLINEKGIVIDTNQQATLMLEKDRDEIIGQTVEVIDPNFPVESFLAFWAPVPFDMQKSFETSHKDKSGSIIPIEINGKKFKIDGATFYYGIARDISDRKQAAVDLKSQRDFLQKVIDGVPSRVFWKDRNYVYRGCNTAFMKECGKSSREEVIGQNDEVMVWKENASVYRADDKMVMDEGKPKLRYEETFTDKNGDMIVWRTSKVPLKNDVGEVIGILASSENISEEKKTEEELKRKQYHLENAQALGKIGSWDLIVDGNKLIWSDENYRIFRLPMGMPMNYDLFLDRVHPEDREYVDRKWLAAMKGEEGYDINHRLLMDDGEVRWVREKADLVFDEEGFCLRGTGFTQDITERKMAEQKLEESHNLLKCFLDNFPDAAWAKDLKGKMILSNQFANEYILEHDMGKTEKDILLNDQPCQVEEQILQSDGIHHKIFYKFPLHGSDGNVIGLGGVAHDITERMRATKTMNAFFDQPMNIHLIGRIDGTILKVNAGWFKILGYEEEEIRGKNIFDFIHPDDSDKTLTEIGQLKEGETTNYFENRYRHKYGSYITLAWSATFNISDDIIYGVAKDITQQKAYHEQLTKSEERYRELVNNVNSGVAIYKVINDGMSGNDYIIQDFNQFALEHEGLIKKDVLGKSLKEIRPNIEEFGFIEIFKKVWETGESTFFPAHEYVDDKYSHFYENRVFKLPSGEIVAVFDDVTDREKARIELAENEEKLKNIIENSTNLFYTHSADGEMTFISPQVKELLGYEPEEVMHHWTEFITDNPMNIAAIESTEKALRTGRSQPPYELEMLRKDGRKIIVEVREAPVSGKGKALSVVGSMTDITERKAAEERLRFLSAITENMDDSIIVTDLQGQISYINKSAQSLFGYTLEELVGKNPVMFNIDPDGENIQRELNEVISRGGTYEGESLNRRKDGSEFICQYKVAPLVDENGTMISFIGIQRDMTEMRNLEKAAIRQERLSAIGELASGVAHDFNNALQIILGGVEMAMAAEEPEEQYHFLESIKYSANDAASRVRKLQKFSHKNKIDEKNESIDINTLVGDVIREADFLLNQYQKQGIHIEIESAYKAETHIQGNEGELRSCLFNLIKNSAEAMPEGGTIKIHTKEHDNKIYVLVIDNGTGMDRETQKKIFQPFYSTKGFEPGRGLGMAQAYSTVRDHNGDISIKESEKGKGTTIEIILPVEREHIALEKDEVEYEGVAKVLWVDDEEMIRILGRKMLQRLGHIGEFAPGGKEALEMLGAGKEYDLVITDVGMPGMSGWQLAEQINKIGYKTKIALVTGWGADVTQEEKNRYNVGYVLGKPVGLVELKALIGEVLQMKNSSH